MADDNTVRSYRSRDSHRRGADQGEAPDQPFGGGSDPLAELARLIGQNDPYTDNRRREPQATPSRSRYDDSNDWRRHVERPNYQARDEAPFDADARYGIADQDARYGSADQHPGYPDQHAGYADHDPYRMTSPQTDPYADPHGHADYRHESLYATGPQDLDEARYAAAPHHAGYDTGHDSGYDARHDTRHDIGHAGGEPPHAEEDYDDPPRRKRGSGLVTAVVLIGCAMLGTAGAYGYRTYANAPGSKQAPVIIADSAPSKVVPSEQKTARSQDRVGQGNGERLVSREEQPVTLPGSSGVPRVVFPSPVTTGSTPPAAASNTQSPSSAVEEQPKRVRTVTIRPEGGDNSAQPTTNEPAARAASPSARTSPQFPPPPPPRASRDQPLSLDPGAPAPQQRAPAPREAAAPAPAQRVASAPASGGFLVQVSSQKSEADAQASYRGLQAKYSQLKSHPPVIRRADLGSKGVYYRAMVGPFESGDEAVQFCNDLKQAGGQCLIHRN
jgi:hypothetical protein